VLRLVSVSCVVSCTPLRRDTLDGPGGAGTNERRSAKQLEALEGLLVDFWDRRWAEGG
jgi:hypothetical protein